MATLRRNLIANMAGKAWSALMALAFVPWYIQLLGLEAYGLVGFFATLQAVSVVLDLGLGTAINRAMAGHAETGGAAARQRELLRTFATVAWIGGILIGGLVAASAGVIADRWINARDLERGTVVQAVQLMGLVIALRWPAGIYGGVLMGLQHQVSLNLITAAGITVANLGVIAVLTWVAPTLEAFFAWQAGAAVLQTSVMAWWAWRCVPASPGRTRFARSVLVEHWRFAVGTGAITALGVLLAQVDKVVLSRLLRLDDFALYALASVVAGGIGIMVGPVFTAVFPRLSAAVAGGDAARLAADYHRTCRLTALLVMPAAFTLALLAEPVLWAWTGDAGLAQATAPILAILVVGSALNGLLMVPYALQLAHGSTRLGLQCNLVAVVLLVPAVAAGAWWLGPAGAALGWPVLNLCYVVAAMPIIHRRFLAGAQRRWTLHDTGIPLAAAALAVAACSALMPEAASRSGAGISAIGVAAVAYAVAWGASRACSGPLSAVR